jgi:hypothetical protein
MLHFLDKHIKGTEAVQREATIAAAAYACNHILGTKYELWNYDKYGNVIESDDWLIAEPVGVDSEDVSLLAKGKLATHYPKEPLSKKVQACFDEMLPRYEQIATDRARYKLIERLKAIGITVAVVGGLLVWGLLGAWHNHQATIAQHQAVTDNNQQGRVTVDNTFSFLLPCTPDGQPMVTDSSDLRSTQVSCSQEDSTGASTFLWQLESEVYKTSKYSPQDDYTNCAAYTSDEGEQYTVIDNHIEDVHGIKFAICNLAGSSGTVDIIAHAVTSSTMQYVRLVTDQQHENNVWEAFRGQLESFQYLQ